MIEKITETRLDFVLDCYYAQPPHPKKKGKGKHKITLVMIPILGNTVMMFFMYSMLP